MESHNIMKSYINEECDIISNGLKQIYVVTFLDLKLVVCIKPILIYCNQKLFFLTQGKLATFSDSTSQIVSQP